MIERYQDEKINLFWSTLSKYKRWWRVELAIIAARCDSRMCSSIVNDIKEKVKITAEVVKQIAAIEAKTHHDLASFVEAMRNQLPDHLKKFVHSGGVTSYDIEEPAMSLMLLDSVKYVIILTGNFLSELEQKATKYKNFFMVAHTHSQHAQPYTLGIKMLGYFDDVRRSRKKLICLLEDLKFSKISGAVGLYGDGLNLEIEKKALKILDLKPADFSRQIILRDTVARVISEIAILGSVLEKIAVDFRLASYTERRELQEPFSKTQKGSSVMPFKKNPITWEKVSGLSRILRSNAHIAMENIGTWEERDISHSSVERIILPDSFHIICHMLTCMIKTVKDLTVNKDQIQKNLNSTLPVLLSPSIATLLVEKTKKDPDEIYRLLQKMAFDFFQNGGDFFELIAKNPDLKNAVSKEELAIVMEKSLKDCYSFVDKIFERVLA